VSGEPVAEGQYRGGKGGASPSAVGCTVMAPSTSGRAGTRARRRRDTASLRVRRGRPATIGVRCLLPGREPQRCCDGLSCGVGDQGATDVLGGIGPPGHAPGGKQ
jgi:hypothetical protein